MKLTEDEKAALRSECDALKKRADAAEKESRDCHEQIRLKQQALYDSECPLEAGKSYIVAWMLYDGGRLKRSKIIESVFEEATPSGSLCFKSAFVAAFQLDGVWMDAQYPYGPVSKHKLSIINGIKTQVNA